MSKKIYFLKTLLSHQRLKTKAIIMGLIFGIVFGFGIFLGKVIFCQTTTSNNNPDKYTNFLMETYDIIYNNYWQKLTPSQLIDIYLKSIEQIEGVPQSLSEKNKTAFRQYLKNEISKADNKKQFVESVAKITIASLEPFGRSSLYTQKEEKALVQRVENINPKTGKKEPTITKKLITPKNLITPNIAYIKIKQFSPFTLQEFQKTLSDIDKNNPENLDSLIIDLRGNVGGSFDLLPYFLGPFIGKDQYAFELYHQGERIPFKTKIGWLPSLVRYKKVVILVDEKTQSSAEVAAAVLKRYNVGILVGTTTRGWGTIEKVFPIKTQIDPNTKYSIFLVHSLTLRDDNQPIEGNGVIPVVDIRSKNWDKKLFSYIPSKELVNTVKKIILSDTRE